METLNNRKLKLINGGNSSPYEDVGQFIYGFLYGFFTGKCPPDCCPPCEN